MVWGCLLITRMQKASLESHVDTEVNSLALRCNAVLRHVGQQQLQSMKMAKSGGEGYENIHLVIDSFHKINWGWGWGTVSSSSFPRNIPSFLE